LTSPIPISGAHPLILVLSYSYLLPIKPDEERKNNWTKVLRDTLVSLMAHLLRCKRWDFTDLASLGL
jgi:hypothetical protein